MIPCGVRSLRDYLVGLELRAGQEVRTQRHADRPVTVSQSVCSHRIVEFFEHAARQCFVAQKQVMILCDRSLAQTGDICCGLFQKCSVVMFSRHTYQTLRAVCYSSSISCASVRSGITKNAHHSARAAERVFVRRLKVGL